MRKVIPAVFVVVMTAVLVSGCATRGMRDRHEAIRVQSIASATQLPADRYVAPSPPPPQMVAGAKPVEAKKYLNVGANPVDPNRPTRPHERVLSLAEDAFVSTRDAKGKVSEGWLKAGEEVFAVPASDPRYWEAIVIKRCGNPITNRVSGIAPIWIYDPAVQAAPVAVQPQVTPLAYASQQQAIPECRERKSGWGSVIGGVIGFGIGLLTHKPALAAVTSVGGSLIGAYADGGCVEPQDALVAVGWGVAGYGLAKPRSHNPPPAASPVAPPAASPGPASPPANGSFCSGGIPGR